MAPTTQRQLEALQGRLTKARESLRVLQEQVSVWNDALEEARIRSLVSETPQLTADYNELSKHVVVATAEMQRRASEVQTLLDERDELLRRWNPEEHK
jgi:predicted  nucleic acid-binding Zn-ribbon protein